MLVRDWMSKTVASIEVDDFMSHAISVMKEKKVRMLPVLKKGELVGVVSVTDIKKASASDATALDVHEMLYLLTRIRIQDIMSKTPITVPPDYTIEETAEVLMTHNVSGVPVVDGSGKVVGIITRNDLFKALISMSGLGRHGFLFGFKIEDRPGSIKELTDVIRAHGGRIASILSSYDRAPAGFRLTFIRAYDIERSKLEELLAVLKQKALMLYYVDHRENRREVYHSLSD